MIPSIGTLDTTFEEVKVPSHDYKVIIDKNRVSGSVDDLEEVKQAIYLILNTERYQFPIYSWDYGIELVDLFNKPTSFVIPELKRRITEALLQDDRILNVGAFKFEVNRNKVHVTFTATCEFGNLEVEKEVTI